MTSLFAETLWTAAGWRTDVRITMASGIITALDEHVRPLPGDDRYSLILPGMPNVHSHAFQRGMAGLTEVRGQVPDSFWTWREAMYRYALTMTPDQLEAIATQLYVEMLEAGFTRVGEFHYLHHDERGRPYADIAEMANRICAAAATTGIGLTLLPTFYAHGGFGGAVPIDGQRRFITDLDSYSRLVERCRVLAGATSGTRVGIAPHSLRAVTPDELAALVSMAGQDLIHIHAAEQVDEVRDCLAWSGQRPVGWLLANAPVDQRWCLVHATHMTDDETSRLAATGAVVGLCPMTEASLGDGTFSGATYVAAGGRLAIGSDSNILIGIDDELRQFETTQRLRDRARNVLAIAGGSTGEALFMRAHAGGSQALAVTGAGIAIGAQADLVSLNMGHPSFGGRTRSQVFDTWIFGGVDAIDCVWVAGHKLVSGGRHTARDAIARRFRETMVTLAQL